jgi:hypothetical protein
VIVNGKSCIVLSIDVPPFGCQPSGPKASGRRPPPP